MNKITQLALFAVLVIVLIHALYNLFFSHSKLKDAVNEIKSVKTDLKMVSDSLSSSRKQIGQVLQNLDDSQKKISLMKKEVEILYLDYQRDDAVSNAERKELQKQLTAEEKYLDSLKTELEKLDQ
jgi:peptidoglycan hydrolase CwlO-like protein